MMTYWYADVGTSEMFCAGYPIMATLSSRSSPPDVVVVRIRGLTLTHNFGAPYMDCGIAKVLLLVKAGESAHEEFPRNVHGPVAAVVDAYTVTLEPEEERWQSSWACRLKKPVAEEQNV